MASGFSRTRAGAGIIAAVIVVAGLTAYLTTRNPERSALSAPAEPSEPSEPSIPPPPDAARLTPAIREQLDAAYRTALQSPASTDAVGDYCVTLHADMLYELANDCYGVVIDRDTGGDWQWLYYRALLRHDLGGGADLAADLRTVVERAPGFSPAWLRLGDAEFKAGRYAEAEAAWTRATALPEPERPPAGPVPHLVEVPVSAYASLGLARIRLMRGDAPGARRLVEQVIDAGPPWSSAYRLLAEIHTTEGRTAEAERALARARRLPPYAAYADPIVDLLAAESRNSTFLIRLASEADLGVNAAWSEFLSRRAVEFDPDNPEVVFKLARVLRTVGKNEEALTHFERYRQLVPGDPQVIAHIGSCLSDLGRFDEAEPLLRQAVMTLDDALSHYNLGLLLATTGRLDAAIAEYELALERDPGDINARINLAAALVRIGRLERAERELSRVVSDDSENPVALTNLGVVRAERGDIAGARRALADALRVAPEFPPAVTALAALARR